MSMIDFKSGDLPEEFTEKLDNDLVLTLARTLVPVGLMEAGYILRADEIIELPEDERAPAFKSLMSEVLEVAKDAEANRRDDTEVISF